MVEKILENTIFNKTIIFLKITKEEEIVDVQANVPPTRLAHNMELLDRCLVLIRPHPNSFHAFFYNSYRCLLLGTTKVQ